ncbi:MAG: hypothetical protein HRT88_05020 [Lentisphaeraceae bacterium]|nr:hypothetical protein [Lentisphaeraceae bacterium]
MGIKIDEAIREMYGVDENDEIYVDGRRITGWSAFEKNGSAIDADSLDNEELAEIYNSDEK